MLVVSALVLPVILLFVGLVVDVGHWYVHKRQLQNRADAGALAAGVDYSANWSACVQDDDPALKAATTAAIEAQARRYAGDPSAGSPFNTEIANQAKLDVVLNSTSHTAGTDSSDGGNACIHHAGDAISPAGGHWVDVKVQERDLPTLFRAFGRDLIRNIAQARVEIHPAVSDNGFIPLAIPETEVVKAQVRYYDECTSPRTLLASANLKPLKPPYQTVTGTVLWGPDTGTPNGRPYEHPADGPSVRALRRSELHPGRRGGARRRPQLGQPRSGLQRDHAAAVRRLLVGPVADPRVQGHAVDRAVVPDRSAHGLRHRRLSC